MAAKNMHGMRFGKLLVTGRAVNSCNGTARWMCVCDCGSERTVAGTSLRAGKNKSCGCGSAVFTSDRVKTHGMSGSRTYQIWLGMKQRCSEKSTGKSRRLYFDRGIRVCPEWLIFENFLRDMGEVPAGMSIDRIDGSLGYNPANCRWATSVQQANNTSANALISHIGETKTIAMWAKEIGVNPNTLLYRIKRGLDMNVAMTKDVGKSSTRRKISRQRACDVCGQIFIPRSTQVAAGRGRYCSQACSGKSKRQHE